MHKTTSTDDKRLQSTLKRLGVNTIPGIEEVRALGARHSAARVAAPPAPACGCSCATPRLCMRRRSPHTHLDARALSVQPTTHTRSC